MATHGGLTALREHILAHPNPKDQGLSSEDDPGAKVRPSLMDAGAKARRAIMNRPPSSERKAMD
jgi:hypothetical protein